MIDRNGAKKAGFNSGFKDGRLLLAESMSIRQLHHKHTAVNRHTHKHAHTHDKESLQMREREEALCRGTIITNAKSSGAKGQTVCDKRTINRTKTPEGEK